MRSAVLLAALAFASCGRPATQAAASEQGPAEAPVLRLSTARAAHEAVALANGDALFFGGCVADSCEMGPASATVDRYDSRRGLIVPAGRLSDQRASMVAVGLDTGQVLLAGGWTASGVTDAVELFDPAKGEGRLVARLGLSRADVAHTKLPDGRVLFAGGYASSRAQGLVELFDPATSTARALGSLRVPRAGAVAVPLSDGRVLIVGGGENGAGGLVPSNAAEIFDPRTGVSTLTGPLAFARYKHAAVALPNGRVLVIGGSDSRDRDGKIRTIEEFDPARGRFRTVGETLDARYKIEDAVAVLADGRVLIAGGAAQPEIYDPATGRSSRIGPNIGSALNFSTLTLLPSGSALVAGGYTERGISLSDLVWKFDPK